MSGCQSGGGSGKDAFQQARRVARTELWKEINSGKASSAGVAILDNGNVVYSEGLGVADREKNLPVTARTLFNMGSTSKSFCATAVMRLVDDGKVKLDAPVTRYLPEFKMKDPRYKDVTVRMLLNHTSGFPGTAYANNMGYAYNTSIYKETLANLARSHLKAAPGETAPYCNDGFTVAEILVTRVSGRDYMDYLSERVLTPLSLRKTGVSVGERGDPDYSAFYEPDTGKKVPAEVLSVLGAGGLSSNAEDLVVFADSFSGGGPKVLSESSIAEMTKAQPSAFAKAAKKEAGLNPEISYGLGFDLTDVDYYKEKGIKVIGKGGDTDDYHSMLLSIPGKRLSVAVMEAGHGGDAPAIAFDVLDSVLVAKGLMKKEEAKVSAPPEPQPIPPEYQAFAGRYAGDTNSFQISFDFARNVADFIVIKGGVAGASSPMTYRDGHFYTEKGARFALISVDGRYCLLTSVFGDKAYMVAGQRLPQLTAPAALGSDINGKQWLRRNVKPFEGITETSNHLAVSSLFAELPGFIDFQGTKQIESPDFAGMAIDVVRDLTELTLLNQNGQTWARVSDLLYSPINRAAPLDIGNSTVTIGKDGYNEWLTASKDLVLDVQKPAKDRLIVFSPDGSPTYDSVIDSGDVFVPQGSLIELAGQPGNVFKVGARSAAGK